MVPETQWEGEMPATVFNGSPGRRGLLEQTELGFAVVDRNRRLIDCNESYCRILGRARTSLIGRSTAEFIVPGDHDVGGSATAMLSSGTDCLSYEKRYLLPDGTTAWARLIVSILSRQEGLYAAIIEDITERKQAEADHAAALAALREKTAFLERAQEVANIATYVADLRTRTLTLSPELARMYGAGEEALELDIDEYRRRFVHPDDMERTTALAEAGYRSGEPVSWERRVIRPDGEVIWVATNSRVEFDADGRPARTIGVVQNITERASAVEELRASRLRISHAAQLERSRLERDLHDGVQQQFTAVRVKLGLAQDRLPTDPADAALIMEQLSTELGDAISQLRNFARGVYPPLLESDGLVAALSAAAAQAAVPTTVEASGAGRLPRAIEAPIYFCCLEAMQNAAEHAGPDAHVRVVLSQAAAGIDFSVQDDGQGFDPAAVQNASGLVHIRDRIESIGGTVSILSQPGLGCQVIGSVPIRR
jgi:PAS domain S-box-containing protein